jgi:uncharacterized protein YukE
MAIKSSPQVVRDMESTLQKTVKSIQGIQQNVKGAIRSSANWNDAQGQEYQLLMKQIAQLTKTPMDMLDSAIPKLEKLAQSLDNYEKVKFK